MCTIVVINRGEKEIQTPAEFIEHFNIKAECDPADLNHCLCGFNVDDILNRNSIPFKSIDGDYYVGQLDQLTEAQ